LFLRQIFSGAVDVKIQHRHRRLICRAFSSFTPLGRTFQRQRNAMRIFPFEDIRLKIERVATLRYSADHLRAFGDFFGVLLIDSLNS